MSHACRELEAPNQNAHEILTEQVNHICNRPEPDATFGDFEHAVNYLGCLQYRRQVWVRQLTGRCPSAQVLDVGAEVAGPAGAACIVIYLLASGCTSAPWAAVLRVGLIGCS